MPLGTCWEGIRYVFIMSLIETISQVETNILESHLITANDELKKRMLSRLGYLKQQLVSRKLSDLTCEKLESPINRLERLLARINENDVQNYRTSVAVKNFFKCLEFAISLCKNDDEIGYNTNSYYENVIKTLSEQWKESQKEIANLVNLNKKLSRADEDKIIIQKEIDELQKKLDLSGGVNRELEEQNRNLLYRLEKLNGTIAGYKQEKEKLIALQNENDRINEIVKKYEIELEKNRQRDDAINNWKNKISEAFEGLEGPINRLVEEHKRLEWLYNVYKWSSAVLVIFLIMIEIAIYIKIVCSDAYPTWDQYLPMALPVPITLGLLWGFITQMNRAQRQMVVLSNKIHETKYTEGLLQALNTLSVDIGESMSKINDAISRLIDNHLHNMDSMRLDEKEFSKIEKQNALPIEQIPELIKLINKSKE